MEANGGGQGPEEWEDDSLAMVVAFGGLVAWVPAQAMAQDDAAAAALRQDAWVPAEAAARTGWIPRPPGMLVVVVGHGALAVALRHGWVRRSDAVERGWVPRNREEDLAAATALCHAGLYLPAQEVARGRSVCRLWRYITQTEVFRCCHSGHRSRTPMPLFLFEDPAPDLPAFNLRAVDIRGGVSRPLLRFNRDRRNEVVIVHGSCAGILLLSVDDRLYACNPCTRRWARLPPLHVAHDIIGFYVTTAPADFGFQVLYHDREDYGCEYWIFTLGTAALAPRCIGIPGPVELLLLVEGVAYAYWLPPVLFRNFLHWLPQPSWAGLRPGRFDILRFNTVAETFSMIPPPSIERVPLLGYQLFEIDQHLAMTVRYDAAATVWVRSNIDQLWRRRYIIHLPEDAIDDLSVTVFAAPLDRNVLVCCERALLQCDAMGAVRQRYQLADHFTLLTWHTIEESLLLHDLILPMRDTDAVDGEPPFFQDQ